MAHEKVTDPQGYVVSLEDERWEHIIYGHPEMRELRGILLETLKGPTLVMRDSERREVHFYYRLTGRSVFHKDDIYMSAVVERSDGNMVARVLTAHLVKHPKKDGERVWFKLPMSSK